ncbi:MAG: hypothetical protein ACRYF3_16750 [Janthinobacterium lividum]
MTQNKALAEWWSALDEMQRHQVLEIEPGEFLSQSLALDLQFHGVHVPEVAMGWDFDGLAARIVVNVQPRVLTDFLAGVRALS